MDTLSSVTVGKTPDYYIQGLLEIEKKKVEILSKQLEELTIKKDKTNMLDNNNMIVEEAQVVVDPSVEIAVPTAEVDEPQTNGEVQEQLVEDAVIENVDNSTLINIVTEKLNYEFANMILVKPLDVEKVFKTLTVPEDSGEKDEDGEPIMQMTIKQIETESLLRKGIVLSIPYSISLNLDKEGNTNMPINVGDTVVYPNKRSIDFDLFKDSALVPAYEVLAKVA